MKYSNYQEYLKIWNDILTPKQLLFSEPIIERLEEKQAELLERIRGLEKWVFGAAAVITAGVTLLGLLAQISKAYL